jgi:hypothetical protein
MPDPDFKEAISQALQTSFGPERMIYMMLNQIHAEMRVLSTTVGTLRDHMIRSEQLEQNVVDLKTEVGDLKKEVTTLKEEKQRRAGMQWLFEWTAKYVPWLAAGVASVWALKSQ